MKNKEQLLNEFLNSGLTQSEFAKLNGISTSSLARWQRAMIAGDPNAFLDKRSISSGRKPGNYDVAIGCALLFDARHKMGTVESHEQTIRMGKKLGWTVPSYTRLWALVRQMSREQRTILMNQAVDVFNRGSGIEPPPEFLVGEHLFNAAEDGGTEYVYWIARTQGKFVMAQFAEDGLSEDSSGVWPKSALRRMSANEATLVFKKMGDVFGEMLSGTYDAPVMVNDAQLPAWLPMYSPDGARNFRGILNTRFLLLFEMDENRETRIHDLDPTGGARKTPLPAKTASLFCWGLEKQARKAYAEFCRKFKEDNDGDDFNKYARPSWNS